MAEIPFGSERVLYWDGRNINIPAPSSFLDGAPGPGDAASFYVGRGYTIPTVFASPSPPNEMGDEGLLYTLNANGAVSTTLLQGKQISFSESPGAWDFASVSPLAQTGFAYGMYFLADYVWGGFSGTATTGADGEVVEIPSITGTGAEPPEYDYNGLYALPYGLDNTNPCFVVFNTIDENYYTVDSVTLDLTEIMLNTEFGAPYVGAMISDGTIYTAISDDSGTFGGIMIDGVLFSYTFEQVEGYPDWNEAGAGIFSGTFTLASDGQFFYASYEDFEAGSLYILEIDRDGAVYNVIRVLGGNAQAISYLDAYFGGSGEGITVTGNHTDGKIYIIGGTF